MLFKNIVETIIMVCYNPFGSLQNYIFCLSGQNLLESLSIHDRNQ